MDQVHGENDPGASEEDDEHDHHDRGERFHPLQRATAVGSFQTSRGGLFMIRVVLAIVAALCAIAVLLGVGVDPVKLLAVGLLVVAVAVVA